MRVKPGNPSERTKKEERQALPMSLKIALAGNPNCGKTTLFNDLTGSTQYVGNWAGVTVEKKEGKLKGQRDVIIQDLPGIYSLSPYSPEEVVSRRYLIEEKPDAILNIIDGSNIERNLYLTTQLLEVGIPTVVAVNMMDIVEKNGDQINLKALSKELGCPVLPMTALHGKGKDEVVKAIVAAAESKDERAEAPHVFGGSIEHALAHIEESIENKCDASAIRWFAVKVFERDEAVVEKLGFSEDEKKHIDAHIQDCEKEMDDDAEAIITDARYTYIQGLVDKTIKKATSHGKMTVSDKIDRVVTNRWLALPIFAVIMFGIYYLVVQLGSTITDWTNDVLIGEWVLGSVSSWMEAGNVAPWLQGLVVDGVLGGVGTVLGFVPQMLVLFLLISILEDSGYMARVAFIMDRIFRRFGLSGKSFIPMLVGTGCGVPAIMATRTIENERDRRMTIMLSTFLPCGAKMEIIIMMVVTFFAGSAWMAPLMYFIGFGIVIISGIALKKTKYFSSDPAPFVMELPAYHLPTVKGVLIHVWERAKAFIIKAGTIIFSICVLLWFLMNFGFTNGHFGMVALEDSMLRSVGEVLAYLFKPLGFGNWQGAVASVSAELAKEQATATLAMLAGASQEAAESVQANAISALFGGSTLVGLSFMLFNIFNAPCLVAIVTAFREHASRKWGWITFAFQMGVGYGLALVVYQLGMLITEGVFGLGTVFAILLVLFVLWALFRPAKKVEEGQVMKAIA